MGDESKPQIRWGRHFYDDQLQGVGPDDGADYMIMRTEGGYRTYRITGQESVFPAARGGVLVTLIGAKAQAETDLRAVQADVEDKVNSAQVAAIAHRAVYDALAYVDRALVGADSATVHVSSVRILLSDAARSAGITAHWSARRGIR